MNKGGEVHIMSNSIFNKTKRKLSVFLIFSMVLFHLPLSQAYGIPDPQPESGSVYVNGIDLLNSDEAAYPEGISYNYVGNVNIITVSGAAITLGHHDGGKYSGIFANEAGDVELVLVGNNTINISNDTEPDTIGECVGIFTGGGNLTFSGTGSLTINSDGRSVHLDVYGDPGRAITFKNAVTVRSNNQIFTEGGGESRPGVNIIDTADVTSHGIECGSENTPYIAGGASYTNTDIGGGDPGGGDPEPGSESLYVNGVDILSEDYGNNVEGLSYDFNSETDTHIITLNGVFITAGDIRPGRQMGIHAPSIGDIEIILIGDNNIIIPNEADPYPEADPPMINGVGIYVSNASLTISGGGTLNIETGDRAIILDAHGATEPLAITFKDSVTVTANNQIFTEGGEESRPVVNIIDTANVTSHGIECGNENTPIIAAGASYTNTDDGGGDPHHPDEPFNLSIGGVDLVIDGEVQDKEIPNLEIIYYEHIGQYSLYLNGGTFGGIYTEGYGRLGIYVEEDSTVNNLELPEYEDYSMVLSAGAEITPFDFLKERDPSVIYYWDNTLSLTGGILSGNQLAFKDDITVNIGSTDARANKGIVGEPSLRVEAVNPRSINIWANSVGVENVSYNEGVKLGSSVVLNINSNGLGATNTVFVVGEGSTLNMIYSNKGDFVPIIYKWDYMDMTGPIETYANMPYTIVDNLSLGINPEDKYSLNETATSYQLISTAKPLYTLGYNYDNNRDGIVDNPDEEIINGRLSIKGATGICHGDSEGFVDYNFEVGTLVTIELLPDYGYQYEAGTLSYNLTDTIDTTPGETRAYYTFIMPEHHVHLYARFTPSSDIIQNKTPVITDALVDIGQNNIHGNVAFEIDTDSPSNDEIEEISDLAGTKVAGAYLDLTLNEYIAKAGTEDAWITELNELDEPVTISLELSADLLGKSDYSVIRIHNGETTVIDTNYSNGVITFDTDKFSTYVIIYNNSSTTPPVVNPPAPSVTTNPTPSPIVTPVPEDKVVFDIDIEISPQDKDDSNMIISSALIRQAIEAGEKVTATVRDKDYKELYTWTFDTSEVTGSGKIISDVNLSLDVLPLTGNEKINEELIGSQGLILSFGHNGDLPTTATVRIYVGYMDNIEPGMQIYLYHYNKETGKLNTLPYSSRYTVDENGYITLNLIHCSDYVVLREEAKANQITSLRNQIEVFVLNNKLYIGGTRENTTDIRIKMPVTLQLVEDLKEATSSKAIGGVTATFASSDEKVLTVDKDGTITAVGVGETIITTTLKLYSGKVKTVKTNITVEEAHIDFKVTKSVMEVNSSYTFRAKAYGFYSKEIIWSTDDESIIAIDKTTGKAVAKSEGTCYIITNVKDAKNKIKITVK